jgi:IclR family mhp operon transcriptional activator
MEHRMKDASIRSIERAIAILQAINRAGGLNIADIALAANLPYPTVFRIVQTLTAEGLIEREPARKIYRPTALVQTLASGYQEDGRLIDAARPHITALTQRHGWPVTVAMHVGFRMMIADSTHSMTSLTFSHYYPGYTLPLLECAVGRAYLSFTSEEERQLIIETLKRIPDITNSHALKLFETGELTEIIQRDGYAAMGHNRFTQDPGKTSSIAVPLYDGDQIVGALALIIFSAAQRLDQAVPRYLNDLRATADAIKQSLAEGGASNGMAVA